jgi:hypothetical protein
MNKDFYLARYAKKIQIASTAAFKEVFASGITVPALVIQPLITTLSKSRGKSGLPTFKPAKTT